MNPAIGQLVTALALAGVLIARAGLARARARSDVALRLRTLYALVAILLALRLVTPFLPVVPVTVALMTVAAWLPMAALRVVEELCRRHAPRPAKLAALGGALGFTVLALTLGVVWSEGALVALAVFQSAMLLVMVVLLARERAALAPAERMAADTFLLALLLTIPLALTDSSVLFPGLPVRGGAIAALVLVLATARAAAARATPAKLLADLAMMAGAGLVTALAARAVGDGSPTAAAGLACCAAAATALVLLIERGAASRGAQSELIGALAATAGEGRAAILSSHPLLESGRLLAETDLKDYPAASLSRILDHPVVSADLNDPEARDGGRDLLAATGATHLLRISREPPLLLAVTAGELAGPALDDELALAARLIEDAQ